MKYNTIGMIQPCTDIAAHRWRMYSAVCLSLNIINFSGTEGTKVLFQAVFLVWEERGVGLSHLRSIDAD